MIQVAEGIAKLDQLRTIQTGVFHYAASGANAFHQTAPLDRFGPMNVQLDIDFGARTIGGGNSRLRVQTGLSGPASIDETLPISSRSFNSGAGDAIFTASSSTSNGTLTIKNIGGIVGNRLKADATFSDGAKHLNGCAE